MGMVDGPDSATRWPRWRQGEGEDKMNAGAMPMPDGVPSQAPNVWAVYFAVDDCDTAMAAGEFPAGKCSCPPFRWDRAVSAD